MYTYYTGIWQWQSGNDYLAHHGILGQRWGRRNGPPYPLSAGAHSSAEKRLKSKNEGKLESWKAKEVAKANKKYDRALDKNAVKSIKLSRKITKDVNDRKFAKYSVKADKLIEQHETLKKAKKKEIDTVMQMSLEDAKAEKAYVGKRIAAKLLLTYIPLPMVLSEAEWDKTRFRNGELQKHNSKKANDNYNKVMLLTAKDVHPYEIASRTGLNLDQIYDYKRGGFGELTPKVKSWVEYKKEAENLTRKFAIPMDQRVDELMRKNKTVDRYAEEHGVNNRNIPKYIQLTGDPELKRLYEAYKDERNKLNKKYPGKMDKWT